MLSTCFHGIICKSRAAKWAHAHHRHLGIQHGIEPIERESVADGVVQRNNEDEILRIFSVNDCNFEENLIAIDGCKSTADAGPRDLLNVAQEIRAG